MSLAMMCLVITFPDVCFARNGRVFQIPNGTRFSCSNCHVIASGGGPRNAFGRAVEAIVRGPSLIEFWS
ncbi:MAG: hypothetical protein L0Z50_03030, partial [Verrucomicrobiales bacterium]|nr:hypothetical protein [Verrucomicrobiales bacterium]